MEGGECPIITDRRQHECGALAQVAVPCRAIRIARFIEDDAAIRSTSVTPSLEGIQCLFFLAGLLVTVTHERHHFVNRPKGVTARLSRTVEIFGCVRDHTRRWPLAVARGVKAVEHAFHPAAHDVRETENCAAIDLAALHGSAVQVSETIKVALLLMLCGSGADLLACFRDQCPDSRQIAKVGS